MPMHRPLWQQLVQNAPSLYAKSLTAKGWREEEAPTVNTEAGQLQQNEDNLSSSLWVCILALCFRIHTCQPRWSQCLSNICSSCLCRSLSDTCSSSLDKICAVKIKKPVNKHLPFDYKL